MLQHIAIRSKGICEISHAHTALSPTDAVNESRPLYRICRHLVILFLPESPNGDQRLEIGGGLFQGVETAVTVPAENI